MRRILMSLLVVFLAAPVLSATEANPVVAPEVEAEAVPAGVADVQQDADETMQLNEITLEERSAADDATAAQLGPRGGFWWLVGVVVVAGVILALVL